jgi:hypothetical protein
MLGQQACGFGFASGTTGCSLHRFDALVATLATRGARFVI